MAIGKYGSDGEPTKIIEELQGMTLRESFKLLPANVKVGTKGGSAFVYCGDTKVLKANLHFVNGAVYKSLQKSLERAVAKTKSLIKNDKATMAGYLRYCARQVDEIEDMKPTMDGFMKYLEGCMEKAKRSTTAIRKCKEKLENYEYFGDRVIVEAYESQMDIGTVIILVEGDEHGWFCDEEECLDAWTVENGKLKVNRNARLDERGIN